MTVHLELLLGLPGHKGGLQHRIQEAQPEGVLGRTPAVRCTGPSHGSVRVAAVPSTPPHT